MAIRVFVVLYFTLYQFGPGLAQETGLGVFRGLLVIPAAAYVLLRAATSARRGAPIPGWRAVRLALLYSVLYSVLYFPRVNAAPTAVVNSVTLIVHVLFWHAAYSASVYRARRRRFFSDIWLGVAVALVAGFLYAQHYIGFQFRAGAIHNLAERTPFIRSDLDVPFFALVLGTVGVTHLVRRRRLLPSIARVTWIRSPSGAYGFGLLSICLLCLAMYSRRTPLFALLLVTAVLTLPTKWGLRSLYATLAFPLIPMFWDVAVKILVPLTQNPVADAILARNDLESYLTATNRLAVWIKSMQFLANVRIAHLWGYGGAPASVLAANPERGVGFTHVHNAFMQVIFDAGVITLLLACFLMVLMYRRLSVLVQVGVYRGDALSLFSVFVGWLVLCGVEPTLRSVSAAHLFFLVVAIAIANLHRETTVSPLSSREIVLTIPTAPVSVLHPSH